MACAFCDLEDVKDREICRNDLAWAFPTNMPIVPGHILICPLRCVDKIDGLTPLEISAIFDLLLTIKFAISKEFRSEGFNFAWNEGSMAGQSVAHLHLHVVPRFTGDSGIYKYEPREFLYRPGIRQVSAELELKNIVLGIQRHL